MRDTHAFELLSKEQIAALYNVVFETDKQRIIGAQALAGLFERHPDITPDLIANFNNWMTEFNALTARTEALMDGIVKERRRAANDH